MTHGFFVTGTDTDVGKTYVATALLRAVAEQGLTTLAIKPVAAGAEPTPQGLRNEDALRLQAVMTAPRPYEQINPILLREPISPHLAACHEGRELSVQNLAAHCRALLNDPADFVLVEGAGGWRVPLNDTEDLSDLARALALPVILVVDMKLGCLNHALLTAEAIRQDGLSLAGWIANQTRPQPMAAKAENLQTLVTRLPAPCLGMVDYRERHPMFRLDLLFQAARG